MSKTCSASLAMLAAFSASASNLSDVTQPKVTIPNATTSTLPGERTSAQTRTPGSTSQAPYQGAVKVAGSATDPATGARFTFDAVGNRISVEYNNGIETRYAYNRHDQLTESLTTKDDITILHQMFEREPSGLVTSVLEGDENGPIRVIDFEYDLQKRLTKEVISHHDAQLSRTTEWTYDKVGNRMSQVVASAAATPVRTTYQYDSNDRLLTETTTGGAQSGTTSYTYDLNGNMLTRSAPAESIRYRYDGAGRMIEMRSGSIRAEFAYDADGYMMRKTVFPADGLPVTQRFVWDRNRKIPQIIEELTNEGGGALRVAATYLFADDLIAQTRDGTTSYVLFDGLGSTRALASHAGDVTDTFAYDAFGNLTERTGTTSISHLYRGEQLDPVSGFYNLRARWMDPGTGRFTQTDPFSGFQRIPSSLHDYTYVANDPMNEEDPTGLTNLIEVNMGTNLSNAGRAAPTVGGRAMMVARNAKIYDVFAYQVLWPWHSYMYNERKGSFAGTRYDVGGVEGGWGTILQAPFSTHDGIVRAKFATRASLKGKGLRVAQFTLGQHLVWHATVHGSDQADCPLDYNLVLGSNCTTWTAWATAKAILISRLKI